MSTVINSVVTGQDITTGTVFVLTQNGVISDDSVNNVGLDVDTAVPATIFISGLIED